MNIIAPDTFPSVCSSRFCSEFQGRITTGHPATMQETWIKFRWTLKLTVWSRSLHQKQTIRNLPNVIKTPGATSKILLPTKEKPSSVSMPVLLQPKQHWSGEDGTLLYSFYIITNGRSSWYNHFRNQRYLPNFRKMWKLYHSCSTGYGEAS